MPGERRQTRAFEGQNERPCPLPPNFQALQIPFSLPSVLTPSPPNPAKSQPANTTLHTTAPQSHEDHAHAAWGAHLRRSRHWHVCPLHHRGFLPSRTKIDRCAPGIRMACCHDDTDSPRKPRMAPHLHPHSRPGSLSPFPAHAAGYTGTDTDTERRGAQLGGRAEPRAARAPGPGRDCF